VDQLPSSERSPKISVITVTKRPGSIDITWASLEKQTFQDFEWILCDELHSWRKDEVAEYVNDRRLRHIPSPTREGDLWNLNKSYNEALRHCRGELVVSLQDYIWIPEDGLEKFWHLYRTLGPHFFTGCATKAVGPPMKSEEGKITIFEAPCRDRPTEIIEYDIRTMNESEDSVERSNPIDWELNWGAAPLSAFKELGGFEERLDREFYSCDNLAVSFRAECLGYQFFIDRTNECTAFAHLAYWPRVEDWEEKHGKYGKFEQWYRQWVDQGMPKLPYL
jgi:glycosyltransferase involved in cell wall biosynthesis